MSAFWFQKTDLAWLAGEKRAIDTELSSAELPRVAKAVLPGSGPFHVQFAFEAAQQGIILVKGHITGQLSVRCQRCLDDLVIQVDSHPRLALLFKEQQRELLTGDYEPITVPSGEVRVADLIEDEILLTLPIAPKHAIDDCGPLNENVTKLERSGATGKAAPFADLAKMMRDQTD